MWPQRFRSWQKFFHRIYPDTIQSKNIPTQFSFKIHFITISALLYDCLVGIATRLLAIGSSVRYSAWIFSFSKGPGRLLDQHRPLFNGYRVLSEQAQAYICPLTPARAHFTNEWNCISITPTSVNGFHRYSFTYTLSSVPTSSKFHFP
jgi:hypothetical protein